MSEQDTSGPIRLTQYSRGAGCGCKIAPSQLEEILKSNQPIQSIANLLVGYNTKDDAAVYDLGNGEAVISTVDFFMPIVDDAFDFGRIASANAISDVYAMGGKPIVAIAILGWPTEKIPATLAQRVLEGARSICAEANIPLAGGHSVDTVEPMFGLAVTGMVRTENLKKNNTSQCGDIIFLSKPIGTGILSTAQKRSLMQEVHYADFLQNMTSLNKLGEDLGKIKEVSAMTDVTGFGLAGHLIEMMEGAGCSAEISYSKIPVINGVKEYLSQRIVPDATFRNWNSYGQKVGFEKGVNVMEAFSLLPDPQTNGGLIFTVRPEAETEIISYLKTLGSDAVLIGRVKEYGEKVVYVTV